MLACRVAIKLRFVIEDFKLLFDCDMARLANPPIGDPKKLPIEILSD